MMKGRELLAKLQAMTPEQLEAPVVAVEPEMLVAYNVNPDYLKSFIVDEEDPELLDLGLKVDDNYIYLKLC